ncbi:hypothetical protein [Candidatus Magnetomonas plexicatena]|uniref:hypothetical protein n=1 Tax=Candidatus Magnetomonas plexicatena TaxID=2552947 RepID=UPI0011016609|nr:hypothetical protein E2O03_014905 [Nitrospirales bacterium LBB_01]
MKGENRASFLQISQHIIALIYGITLRILREDAVENVYENLCKSDTFKKEFPDIEEFKSFIRYIDCNSDTLEYLDLFEKNGWVIEKEWLWETMISNPNLYHKKATQHKKTGLFCTLCNLKKLVDIKAGGINSNENDSIDIHNCITGMIEFVTKIEGISGYLIGGLLWELPENDGNKIDDNITKHIQRIIGFHRNESVVSESDLNILAHHRTPITKERLEHKAQIVKKVFEKIISLKSDLEAQIKNFGRYEQIALVETVSFLSDNLIDSYINSFIRNPENKCKDDKTLELYMYFKLSDRYVIEIKKGENEENYNYNLENCIKKDEIYYKGVNLSLSFIVDPIVKTTF